MIQFVDRATITVESGRGGDGAVSFHREKYVPKGGPDGGDGGRGGSVLLAVEPNLGTLRDFQYHRRFKAGHGQNGMGKKMYGADGGDCVIKVPPGTLALDAETGEQIADLVESGQDVVVAAGGRGGKGNVKYATSTNQTPRVAERGEPGRQRTLLLELKLLADVGLVGFPNAGKSTLLSKLTQARPKVAGYPFTTLSPNLGVMASDRFQTYTVADLPGLIEGAHQGRGLGLAFLRHIERTRMLVYLIDASGKDPWRDHGILVDEIKRYDRTILKKSSLTVFNKMDLVLKRPRAVKGKQALYVSALQGTGIDGLRAELLRILEKHA